MKFSTTDHKLAAFLLAELPDSSFEILPKKLGFHDIVIYYSDKQETLLSELVKAYIDKRAQVDLYKYNKNFKDLRSAMLKINSTDDTPLGVDMDGKKITWKNI